ncbi:MAG: sigma-70 family RNA polymerase sigma factor [Myxococcales bacterium]|nr:sigma-70 family RNA polymerase sigma factor [Myxococcota bacterium]MDW8281102.1 sigma-70 family RNA polymerase sigma factor [Myxococcales bacterium]
MGPLRERLLIKRLQSRDEQAFVEFVRTYQDRIYNLVYRMLGSHQEAEDIAQEVFVMVFKTIDSFRGECKFSTWLYRIATNLCKNRIKYLGRRAQQRTHDLDSTSEGELLGAEPSTMGERAADPHEALAGLQLERIVREGIARLDEEHRMLIVLRDIEELSYEEIVEITGLPEGTVKSRLHRARMALKEHMARHMK